MTASVVDRVFSRDPRVLQEDMRAGLAAALGDEMRQRQDDVDRIVHGLATFEDSQDALRAVLDTFGPAIFGRVTNYHLTERTSLMGQSETLTMPRSLAAVGLRVRDLCWPKEDLNPEFWTDEDGPLFSEDGTALSVEGHGTVPDLGASGVERIADDLVDRAMDFPSIRDLLVAAASAGSDSAREQSPAVASQVEQKLRMSLGVEAGSSVSEIRDRLVRRALDRDGWGSRGDTYRAAVDVVLEALGLVVADVT